MHNEDQIKKLDLRIGDVVYVEKGGEIIPKVVAVEKEEICLLLKNYNTLLVQFAIISYKSETDAKHYCPNQQVVLPK